MALASRDAEESVPGTAAGRLSGSESKPTGRFGGVLGPLRIVVGILLFGLVALAVVESWDDVRATLARISPLDLVLSEVLVLTGLAASVLTWRVVLRELGSTVPVAAASKIYLLGQLGKYLPGSFWALVVQMELAARAGVHRPRALAAGFVAIGVNLVVGLTIGLFVVPSVVAGGSWRTVTIVGLLVGSAVALSPPVLRRLVNVGLRLVRRPAVERNVSWRGIFTATGWSVASFASYGIGVWVISVAVGAPAGESLPLCLGGTALAMTLGFLVFVAPSGIGVREAVIVAALAPVLDRPEALAVALAARLLFTLADLLAAAVVAPVRLRPSEGT